MPTAIQQIASRKITGTIPALSSEDFDLLPFASFSATKYIIEVSKPDGTNFQALEIFGTKILADVDDQVYSKFPNGLSIGVKLLKIATDVVVRITNNENFLVNVSIVKSKT